MRFRPRLITALACFVISLLTLAACGGSSGAGGTSSETLTIAASVDADSFDPAQAHQGHYVQYYQPVYDSLLRRKPDGTIVPMLATEWSYNDDRTELTLQLRKGVKFTDGTPVDAEAVKFNLDRFRNGNGPDASLLSLISAVETKGKYTVVIKLKAPDPGLLNKLAYQCSYIASPKAIKNGNIATDPVGSGPYMFEASASKPGAQYTFVKNPDYWNPSLQKFDKIVIKPLNSASARLNALLSGQVDAAILASKQAERAKAAGMTAHFYHVNWRGLFLFDRTGEHVPALGNVKVRRAINYAINKKAILTQVRAGLGEVTSQILPPDVPGYVPELDHAYPYNPDKARQLLEQAGYGQGFNLTIPTVQGFMDPALTAAIGQNLKEVGINVTWRNVAISDYIANLIKGKYPVAFFSEAQGTMWWSIQVEIAPDATYNPYGTSDPKVQAWISTVQNGSDAERKKAATELNRYLVEQAWFAPFYRPKVPFFTNETVTVQPQELQVVPSIYNYAPARNAQ